MIYIVRKEAAALVIGLYHWRAVFLSYRKEFIALKSESIFPSKTKNNMLTLIENTRSEFRENWRSFTNEMWGFLRSTDKMQ